MRTHVTAAILFVTLLVSAPPARAQSQATTGLIEGTVSDASGGRLPGATVTLVNTGTNATRDLVTDGDGRFRGLLLPLGTYRLTVVLAGFSTYTQEGIELAVGQTANIPIVLQLSSVQEQITVTSDSPVVETTRAEQSTRINQQAMAGLPNNGRNFLAFMQLTPGVAIVQGPDGDEISVNGQKGINNNISVDGADFNNPFFGEQRGGQRPAFTFNQDAVKEMVVVADGAAPEFGRSGAGFINVVTKSGTNAASGTAHFFFKADGLSSENAEGEKFPFDQQQYGATFGGPLKKDKLFFFLAYDEQQFDQTKQLNPNRIEAQVVNYLASVGSPAENGPIDRTNDARVFLGKVDYQLNPSNLFSIRYNYTWSEQQNGTFDVDSWGRSANAVERGFSNAVSGSLATTLSGSMLNEFRFQFAREDRPRPYDGPLITGQSRPLPDTAFDFGSGYRVGCRFSSRSNTTTRASRSSTTCPGSRAGTRSRPASSSTASTRRRPSSDSPTAATCSGARPGSSTTRSSARSTSSVPTAPPACGRCPAGTSITGPLLLYLQQAGVGGLSVEEAGTQDIPQMEPALFIQDKWQPNEHLTVSYGVRWEAQIQPEMITPRDKLFYREFLDNPAFPSDGTIPSDKSMWQPRLGISWDPGGDGKQVVRASAGIFYARIPGLNLASTRSTDGTRGQTLYRDSTFNGFGLTPPTWPNLIPQSQISSPDHPDVFVFDKNFRNPAPTPPRSATSASWWPTCRCLRPSPTRRRSTSRGSSTATTPVFGRPWATGLGADNLNGIATLTTVESSAKSKYDAFTVGMNKRYAQNYQFQWNYTFGRDMSDDDNERDPFTLRYARADNLAPEYTTQTATSGTASMPGCW